jgi:serine/threonine-protein kinase HipA
MALPLDGSTKWPSAKKLSALGETRMMGAPSKVRQILERVSDAMTQTAAEVRAYIKEHPEFAEIGDRMLGEWEKGRELSLQSA